MTSQEMCPRNSGYRVSEAAGVGHPTGQGSRGTAVVVLVFAPVSVVFPATALELKQVGKRAAVTTKAPRQTAGRGPARGRCDL